MSAPAGSTELPHAWTGTSTGAEIEFPDSRPGEPVVSPSVVAAWA
nr:hypothetical protein [Streptomyces xanthochromogenes]